MFQRQRHTLEVHRHGVGLLNVDEMSKRLVSFRVRKSRAPPYGQLTVTLTATVPEAFSLIITGDWVVLRDVRRRPVFWGRVFDKTSAWRRSTGERHHIFTFTAETWFDFVCNHPDVFSPKGDVRDVGTLFSMQTWRDLVTRLIVSPSAVGNLGTSLEDFHRAVMNVRLPESLGGEMLGDAIRVVHNAEDTGAMWAPNRVIESPAKAIGQPMQFGSLNGFYRNKIGNVFVGTWQSDPSFTELFPSDEVGGKGEHTALSRILGVDACLLWREVPYRARPLRDLVVSKVQDRRSTFEVALTKALNDVSDFLWVGPLGPDREPSFQAMTDAIAKNMFESVTWDYDKALVIPNVMFGDWNLQWSDAARVNAASIPIDVQGDNGVEGLPKYDLPITLSDDEVINHGLRLMKPPYPYKVPSLATQNAALAGSSEGAVVEAFLRTICAAYLQFFGAGHLMANGTLDLVYTEALVASPDPRKLFDSALSIPVGTVVALECGPELGRFYSYVTAIEHGYSREGESGAEHADTQLTVIRGHFQQEIPTFTEFPIAMKKTVPTPAPAATPKTVSTRSPAAPELGAVAAPVASIVLPGIYVRGQVKAAPFAVTHYHLVPNEAAPAAVKRYRDESTVINNIFVHYTNGNVNSRARQTRDGFQRRWGKPNQASTHFLIDPDGSIMQIVDCAIAAIHVVGANFNSIGIDFVCPYDTDKFGRYPGEDGYVEPGHLPPFELVSGWTIISASGQGRAAITPKNVANAAQRAAARKLIAFLRTLFPVPGVHDPGTTEPKAVRRFTEAEKTAKLASGGVWHHMQFNSTRADSICTDLKALL